MKKLQVRLVVLLLIMLSMAGCSDDDGMDAVQHSGVEESILGKWFPQGGTINGGEFTNYTGDDCEDSGDYQEFLANGELKFVGYNEACAIDETIVSPYTISGDVLIVTTEFFGDREFTIQSITSQQLILKSTYDSAEGQVTETSYFMRN